MFLKSSTFQKDQDYVVRYVGEETAENFDYIVTRPGMLREGRRSNNKKPCASKSQPAKPITYSALAEFTLDALQQQRLYNTCPYVVADGV